MSLQAAAQHLASRGRGPDTMLVHMAPSEVSGLQALAKAAGGTLSVNPDTGLPEAGFLKSLLPTLIGAALTPLTGGLINPMTAGLLVGGIETARTGSLGKGIMAGLGAYGGAGIGSALTSAGSAAAQQAAMAAVPKEALAAAVPTEAAIGQGLQAATSAASPVASPFALGTQFGGAPALTSAAGEGLRASVTPSMMGSVAPEVTQQGLLNQAAGTAAKQFGGQSGLSQLGQGIQALGTQTGRDAFMTSMGGPSGLMRAGLGVISPMMSDQQTTTPMRGETYEYTYDPNTSQFTQVPVGTRDKMGVTPSFYADGGPVDQMSERNEMLTVMANGGQMFARGGISHLGDYSDGGRLLRGPGDGVSDSIPATIADKRPARLADGEFVVPARIVSELGNGSTEAGARKLYAMMDRVQKARGKTTGKNRVAVNSRADKALPA